MIQRTHPRLLPLRPERRALSVLVVAVGAIAFWGCGKLEERAWKSHKKPPRVSFDHSVFELGEVRQGKVVRHDFPFRNLGELDLTVDRTRSTRECTVTLPTGNSVEKNGSGVVRVELDTSGQAGELRRTVTIYTNDPRKRTVLLTLVGRVVADIFVEPRELYVGSVTRGSLAPTTFAVTTGNKSIRVGTASEDNPYFKLRSIPSPDNSRTTILEVRIADDAPFAPFDQVGRIPTSSPRHPALRLRVVGIVRHNVTASPDSLAFGDVSAETAPTHQLLLRNRGRSRVRVTAAEWVPNFGSVEIDTLREGRRYRIRAKLNPDNPPGDLTSVLRLTTDDAEQPLIEIPVQGQLLEVTPAVVKNLE